MRLIAIETATEICSIALAEDDRILAETTIHEPRKHSELLATLIEQAVTNLGFDMDSLNAVAVSIGPGSFTGLRIGLSTAKGLLFSREGTLLTIPTLAASAWSVRHRAESVAVLHHSHRDTYFLAAYELNERPEVIIQPVRDSLAKLPIPLDMPVVYQTPQAQKIEQEITNDIIGRNIVNARNIAELALNNVDEWTAENPYVVEPDYLKDYEAVKFSNPLKGGE